MSFWTYICFIEIILEKEELEEEMTDVREKLIKIKNGRKIKNLWEIIMYLKYLYISLLRTFRNTTQGNYIN